MQLSQLVTSLETSQKLKALGVEQDSLFYFLQTADDVWWQELKFPENHNRLQYWIKPSSPYTNVQNPISAFTSAELWEILPYNVCHFSKDGNMWLALHWHNLQEWHWEFADNEAEARWKLLIYLKENNLV